MLDTLRKIIIIVIIIILSLIIEVTFNLNNVKLISCVVYI